MANTTNNTSLTPFELSNRDHQYIERIIADDDYAYYFFHKKCYPLFRKIQWTIFNNDADYDELINSFYQYLKSPDQETGEYWHKLKTFDYKTSLFDWIKTVAVRYFYKPCSEKLVITENLISSGLFEEIITKLKSPDARKYFWYSYKQKVPLNEMLSLLKIDSKQLVLLRRRSESELRKLVKKDFPDHYDTLFHREEKVFISIDKDLDIPADTDSSRLVSSKDIHDLVDNMPNKRYQMVITELFFNDMTPEELALKLDVRVSNIYNLKARALEQLRDIILYCPGEIEIQSFIKRIPDDRLRYIADSIFEKQMEYDTIISQLGVTNKEFKRLKLNTMKELKLLIFG